METSKIFKRTVLNFLVANERSDCSVSVNGGEFNFSHDLKGFFYIKPCWNIETCL